MTKNFVVVLMAMLCLHVSYSYAQDTDVKVTIHLSDVTLKEVFKQMQQQTGMIFGFQSRDLERQPKVSLQCSNMPVQQALKLLLEKTSLTFAIRGQNVLIRQKPINAPGGHHLDSAAVTQRVISGRVTNADGQGIPGATVTSVETGKTAFTNDNGDYFIKVSGQAAMLTFSSVGFEHRNVMLGSAERYSVTLKERVGHLKTVEVVATGYVNLPKERATGSFGVVTAKQLEKIPVPNVLNRLEGQVPGVQLNLTESDNSFVYSNLTGDVQGNGSYAITIRGASTTSTDVNKKPLLVIDGFPSELDIRTINPNDVEQITFLKDAAAASIWGARASAGVIVITTKKGKINDGQAAYFLYSRRRF